MSYLYNKKHYKYQDWHIFPNAILSNINLSDCDDSIDGICHHTSSLEDCINICKNAENKDCKTGYFIETKNNKNYCVPLRQHNEKSTTPYYRLRDKNIYSVMKDMKTFVFSSFPYPPNIPNVLFYTDHFTIKNIKSNTNISLDEKNSISEKVSFSKNPIHLQLLPSKISRDLVENYVFVRNGDELVVNIPKTAFVLRKNSNTNQLDWDLRASATNVPSSTFQIFGKNARDDDVLNYTDTFYFTYQGQLVVFDSETETLTVINKNLQDTDDSIYFKLSPKVEVNYCEKGKCKTVSLDKTEMNGEQATYNNIPVERSSNCWGDCGNNKTFSKKWFILILIIVIITIIILYVRFSPIL